MSSEQEIEQQIMEAGKTAPRVTPEHIDECIVDEVYFTANQGVMAATGRMREGQQPVLHPLNLLTICVLVLRNGFTVTGESACASPENFDAEIGKRIARDNAREKVWMLEGYALKERLNLSAYPERAK